MRKPPEIFTTAARISRLRHTKSTERAQAGGVGGGVESEKREALIWLSRAFRLPERSGEQFLDGLLAVLTDRPGSGAGEVRGRDQRPLRSIDGHPRFAVPPQPALLFLI